MESYSNSHHVMKDGSINPLLSVCVCPSDKTLCNVDALSIFTAFLARSVAVASAVDMANKRCGVATSVSVDLISDQHLAVSGSIALPGSCCR